MKKLLIAALMALSPIIAQANLFSSSDDHKEFTVRATAIVIGLYGAHTMVSFKKGAWVRNIFRIPVGGALAAAGTAGAFFAPEVVKSYNAAHDQVMSDYLDAKLKNDPNNYTPTDAFKHAWLKAKSLLQGRNEKN